ncbi:MAG: branched-chain amino acid ABC transporter permease [Actinomycetota bacterium]|nr:branched-chain amino acid ABC transporter permease [Actinomycetota bacterium]
MNGQVSEFIASGVLYVFLYVIAGWGLNLQFGTAGIINFGYIMCEALGAYTVALFAIGRYRLAEGEQHALFALSLPFPIPVLLSLVVGGVFSGVIGVIVLRRVRQDQQAVVLLAITLAAVYFVQADPGFLNGAAGISLIPQPVIGSKVATPGYEWAFVAAVAAVTLACWWLIRATTESPFGRALRALRDHEGGAEALGYGAFKLQLKAFVIGGVLASLAGGILAYFVTTWSPAAWGYTETFWFFAVVIVGGTSNLEGVVVGALIIVGLQQAFEYLPTIGASELGVALQTICAAVLTVGFLALRPKGILPERRHKVYEPSAPLFESGRELVGAER